MSLWRRSPPGLGRPATETSADPVPASGPSLPGLLDLLPHPVVALDGDGGISHVNQTAHAQFGDALPALLRHPSLVQAIRTLPPGGAVEVDLLMDVPVRRSIRARIRSDVAVRPGLALLSLTDRSELEAVERMRVDFIANASHELRTPLASLIGFIETLQGPAADDAPARIRFLSIMEGQAARMRRLIDNLLSLSRIQMHEHQRPSGLVSLSLLARRVADEHAPQLAAAGNALAVEIAPSLPLVAGDGDQLAQVLHNFLDNAVKYANRPGRPARLLLSVQPSRADIDPSADGVVMSLQDDGPGIAPRHVPRLTERFYRVDDGPSGKAGSGLGLAIVKHIVGRHGGRLTITSLEGQGCRFSVWMPRAPVPVTAVSSANRSRL